MAESFSTPSSHIQIYTLQKKSNNKTTKPAFRSGLLGGHHNQLDDQDKVPMIDTKII